MPDSLWWVLVAFGDSYHSIGHFILSPTPGQFTDEIRSASWNGLRETPIWGTHD